MCLIRLKPRYAGQLNKHLLIYKRVDKYKLLIYRATTQSESIKPVLPPTPLSFQAFYLYPKGKPLK